MEEITEYVDGTAKYRCRVRRRLIVITPEEYVRQTLLGQLLKDKKIPLDMIGVEERLDKYDIDGETNCRADIIVRRRVNDGHEPLILIECKRQAVPLTGRVINQVDVYNSYLNVDIIGVTNGRQTDWYWLDENTNEYEEIEDLPTYEEIMNKQGFVLVERQPYYATIDEEMYEEVPLRLRSFVMNLEKLFKQPHIENREGPSGDGFSFIDDLGAREQNNSNASGYSWNDEYRCFDLKCDKTYTETIGFMVAPSKDSYLAVSFSKDAYGDTHNSLQLKIGDWIRMKGDMVEVWHDGRITVGRLGSRTPSMLVEFVEKRYPELVVNGYIFLGSLDNSREFTFEQEDVKLFLTNLIKYVLCREAFRDYIKQMHSENSEE